MTNKNKTRKTDPRHREVELVAALIANRPKAWRTLLTEYGGAMRGAASRVVRKVARHLPSDFVQDIQQQVFVNLLQNDKLALRSFNPALASLRTYLSRIAANLAHDELARFLRVGCPLDLEEVIDREGRDDGDSEEHRTASEDLKPSVDFGYWVGARRAISATRKNEAQS